MTNSAKVLIFRHTGTIMTRFLAKRINSANQMKNTLNKNSHPHESSKVNEVASFMVYMLSGIIAFALSLHVAAVVHAKINEPQWIDYCEFFYINYC